jgi:ATP phosphoribosyltransferase regulatory subunit
MNESQPQSLLPNGLRDALPPEAGAEARAIGRLLDVFHANAYDRVEPPLVEFEQSLLDGPGQAVSPQTFRLMDPVSQRMMGLRADITPQIARIAATRLARAPRPLRLSYAGQVLRVRGNQLRPERQFAQVGVELIGAPVPSGDVEVVVLAAESLSAVGVPEISIDLSMPTLVPIVCQDLGLAEDEARRARIALDRKDPAALVGFGDAARPLLTGLLDAAGPADQAIAALDALSLSDRAKSMCAELAETIEHVAAAAPALGLTVDPVEFRGMEYQTGVSFTIFTPQVRSEIGRGGRYELNTGESATGFTLFMDALVRALPEPEPGSGYLAYLPYGTSPQVAARIRGDGWRTLQALSPEGDASAEARRLKCSHMLNDDNVIEVT